MKVGDIVLYNEARWKVISHSTSFRTCQLADFVGTKLEVPDDLETGENPRLHVLYNPAEQWPFVVCSASRGGPLRGVTRGGVGLSPMEDWIPSDFLRPNGAIFFNPKLRLRVGEILTAVHLEGLRTRLTVTKTFGTITRRKGRAREPARVQGPLSSLDRLLGPGILDEDED
jgi:hypothetical protein